MLSLSFAAPAVFPAVHEQAMRRLRTEFGLEPVEYPLLTRAAFWPARAHLRPRWRPRAPHGVPGGAVLGGGAPVGGGAGALPPHDGPVSQVRQELLGWVRS